MNTFNKPAIRLLRSELETALSTVARHHNISLDLNTIRFSELLGTFRCTLNGAILKNAPAATGHVRTVALGNSAVIENALSIFGIPTTVRAFRVGGTRYTLTGAKLTRPKYPFIGVGPQGGRYRFTVGQVKSGAIL